MSQSNSSLLKLLREASLFVHLLPGGYRFAEVLRKQFSSTVQEILLTDFDKDLKMCVQLSDHIGGQIFWHGYYSDDQLKVVNAHIKPTDVVFDIGANIGEFSVFVAKRVSQGFLHSFEPTKRLSEVTKNNLQLNEFKNTTVHQIGFSHQDADLPIYKSVERGADGAINNGLNSLFKDEKLDVAEVIHVTRLDDWFKKNQIPKINFIKMDIEGAELFALQGGQETIRQQKPKMIIEVNPKTCERAGYTAQALVQFIGSLGYTIHNIDRHGVTSPAADLNEVTRDILCLPKNK